MPRLSGKGVRTRVRILSDQPNAHELIPKDEQQANSAKNVNPTDDGINKTSLTTVENNNEKHHTQGRPAMSYVLYFSKPFTLAIALWPFLSLLLTLPVLALLYHRDNRLRFSSALTAYLIVLYLIALACFTLYPMPENAAAYCVTHHLKPQLNPLEFIHDIQTDGLAGIMQLGMNVVFFIPLGFFMKRTFRWKLAIALPITFLTSLLIETTQLTGIWGIYPCAYRLFDVDDLITNTVGGALGFAIGNVINRLLPQQHIDKDAITTNPGFIRRCVALAIDLLIIGAASVSVSAFVYLVGAMIDVNRANDINSIVSTVSTMVMFVLFEGIIPWNRNGRTLGGGFTRMTMETEERSGMRRGIFYMARMVVLYCAVYGLGTSCSFYVLLLDMALIVFWCAGKRMPYDCI
jgi:glycopeptide antibiotics resistance protein